MLRPLLSTTRTPGHPKYVQKKKCSFFTNTGPERGSMLCECYELSISRRWRATAAHICLRVGFRRGNRHHFPFLQNENVAVLRALSVTCLRQRSKIALHGVHRTATSTLSGQLLHVMKVIGPIQAFQQHRKRVEGLCMGKTYNEPSCPIRRCRTLQFIFAGFSLQYPFQDSHYSTLLD